MATKVFFGGLPVDITREELETYLVYHNPVSMDVHPRRGIAFVKFNTSKDAAEVIRTFHQKILLGRKIIVDEARHTSPDSRQSSSQSISEKHDTPESPSSASDGPPPVTPHTTPPSHAVVLKEIGAPIEGQIPKSLEYLETNQKREPGRPPSQPRLPSLHSSQSRSSPPQAKRPPIQPQFSPRHTRFSPYNGRGRPRSYSNRGIHPASNQSIQQNTDNFYYPSHEPHPPGS